MIYLRKGVVDALYRAGLDSSKWQGFVNETIMEKLMAMEKGCNGDARRHE